MSEDSEISIHTNHSYFAINLIWLVITLLVFFALVKLGLWQTDRAAEKTERLDRIALLINEKNFSLTDIESFRSDVIGYETINDLPVSLEGKLDDDVIFLLDNQMSGGKFGYRVLQLVKTSNLVENYAVLVNLGWVEGDRTRQMQPNIKPLNGSVTLTGHVRLVEEGIMLTEQNFDVKSWPMLIQQIELNKMAKLIGVNLLPFVIYLDKNEEVGYRKNWQPIVMPPEKHQGYAFQWFSLAIAWLLLMAYAARKTQIMKLTDNKTDQSSSK